LWEMNRDDKEVDVMIVRKREASEKDALEQRRGVAVSRA